MSLPCCVYVPCVVFAAPLICFPAVCAPWCLRLLCMQQRVPFPVLSPSAFAVVFPLLESILSAEHRDNLPLINSLKVVSTMCAVPKKFKAAIAPDTAFLGSDAHLATTYHAVAATAAASSKTCSGALHALRRSELVTLRALRARVALALLRALPTAGAEAANCRGALVALLRDAAQQWDAAMAQLDDAAAAEPASDFVLITSAELTPLLSQDGLRCPEEGVRSAVVAALTQLLLRGDGGDASGAGAGAGAGVGAGAGTGADAAGAASRFAFVQESEQPALTARLWQASHDDDDTTADDADALWVSCGLNVTPDVATALYPELSSLSASVRHAAGRAIASVAAEYVARVHAVRWCLLAGSAA